VTGEDMIRVLDELDKLRAKHSKLMDAARNAPIPESLGVDPDPRYVPRWDVHDNEL
jgi:hypothetical protein